MADRLSRSKVLATRPEWEEWLGRFIKDATYPYDVTTIPCPENYPVLAMLYGYVHVVEPTFIYPEQINELLFKSQEKTTPTQTDEDEREL